MAWLLLLASIFFEVGGTLLLKLGSQVEEKVWLYNTGVVICYVTCFGFMQAAMRYWDMGVMYAIWAGLGVILLTTLGIAFFGDALNWAKTISILLIVAGVVGLNLSGVQH